MPESNSSDHVIHLDPGEYIWKPGTVRFFPTTPSRPAVFVKLVGARADRAPEGETAARMETDWFDSALFLFPKRWREEGLGDLLEERATWQARGRSRLSIEVFTVSQLVFSALALVWSAAKDLLTEIVRRYLGL